MYSKQGWACTVETELTEPAGNLLSLPETWQQCILSLDIPHRRTGKCPGTSSLSPRASQFPVLVSLNPCTHQASASLSSASAADIFVRTSLDSVFLYILSLHMCFLSVSRLWMVEHLGLQDTLLMGKCYPGAHNYCVQWDSFSWAKNVLSLIIGHTVMMSPNETGTGGAGSPALSMGCRLTLGLQVSFQLCS